MEDLKNTTNAANAQNPEVRTVYVRDDETAIDLLDLFMVYIKKWWLLGIISLACAVIVFLGIKLYINKNSERWTINAEIGFPGAGEWKYPDGSPFTANDFISAGNINEVLESNEAFASLKAENIREGLSVTRGFEIDKDNVKVWNNSYNFSVKAKAFSSEDQALQFLNALVKNVEDKFFKNLKETTYDSYLIVYDASKTFEDKLTSLNDEKNYIISLYDGWIESYGNSYKVNASTLKTLRENVNAAFSNTDFTNLDQELNQRQYVYLSGSEQKDEEQKILINIETLQDQHEDNEKKMEQLYGALETLRKSEISGTADSSGKSNETLFYEEIARIAEEQVDIERKIHDMTVRMNNINLRDDSNAFEAKLDSVRTNLSEQAEIVSQAAISICNSNTFHVFDNAFTSNAKSAALYSVVAFILAYLATGFIIFIIETQKKRI